MSKFKQEVIEKAKNSKNMSVEEIDLEISQVMAFNEATILPSKAERKAGKKTLYFGGVISEYISKYVEILESKKEAILRLQNLGKEENINNKKQIKTTISTLKEIQFGANLTVAEMGKEFALRKQTNYFVGIIKEYSKKWAVANEKEKQVLIEEINKNIDKNFKLFNIKKGGKELVTAGEDALQVF